jgi:transketolase
MNQDLKRLRMEIVNMVIRGKEGHIPSSFSLLEIIYFIYSSVLRKNFGDRFVLSKGHAATALYVVLTEFKLISRTHIEQYGNNGSSIGGHPDRLKIDGVEASTGSLGHGMPFATGLALANKIIEKDERVYCLVGDGECQEGTIWEAANIASNNGLGKLCVIVDWNGSGAQLQPIENLHEKWSSFGWEVFSCDGNSLLSLANTFALLDFDNIVPKLVIAKTIKGFGVSFLQGHGEWHHKIPNTAQLQQIENELLN